MPVRIPSDPVIAAALATAAIDTGVPTDVVHGVAWVESRYKPDARSPAGAMGLMQLMPGTAQALGVDPWNPVQNALGGATFLRQLYLQFGGKLEEIANPQRAWELAFAGYNWGPSRVKANPDPLRWPEQVRSYVLAVWRAAGWPLPFEVEQRFLSQGDLRSLRSRSRRS